MTAGVAKRSEARAAEEAIGRAELVAEIWRDHIGGLPCVAEDAVLKRDAEELYTRLRSFGHLLANVLREKRRKRRARAARRAKAAAV